jgi:predicted aspartyl protease
MSIIRFDYLPKPERDPETGKVIGETFYPLIPIRICYAHRLYPYYIDSLIDSGADRNLFPAYFAKKIGINIKKGKPRKIRGIGNVEIEAYTHSVMIYVKNRRYQTVVDFSEQQQIPLLGRNGFFNLFKRVAFFEKLNLVELEERESPD